MQPPRPHSCYWLRALLVAALLWQGQWLAAQQPSTEDAPASQKPLPSEVLPQVYHLKDADGNLQPMPAMRYEQFMEAWKQLHQVNATGQRPRFTIDRLQLTGSATGAHAELVARIQITTHAADWVEVPLRLSRAMLREATYQGPGEHALEFDEKRQGYIAWLRGPADKAHELSLKLVVPVEQVGPQARLRLSVPRATQAELQLQVPLERAVAEVSEGSTLDGVRALAGGKTELKVIGLRGEFEMTWHPAASVVAGLPTVLEATGSQLIRMNGRSINTEARLTVRSLGSEFDHFRVRLPPGADYVGAPQAGITLVAVDADAAAGKLYEVRLDKKTTGPVEVRLVTERAHHSTPADEMLQLAGFEVPGAVRQWGTIAVQVEGNWQVMWGESNLVQPVDDVRAAVPREDLVGAFEYFVQPYALAARIVPQTTRIRVEPQYILLIGGDEVRLQGRLRYTIRGAKVRSLPVELPGWELDSIGPAAVVNVDAAMVGVNEAFAIPLVQAAGGQLDIEFEAHQKLPAGPELLAIELPRPQGDLVAADVIVQSDDNVELTPEPEDIDGLVAQTVRPQVKLPPRQQDPLFYRASGDTPRFVARVKQHEQSISAALATQLNVDQRETHVEQKMTMQIAYRQADFLTLNVPRGIRGLSVFCDDQRLQPQPLRARADGDEAVTPNRVSLPAPRIGRCELIIHYVVRHDSLPRGASTLVAVPLVTPGEGQLTANELRVTAAAGIGVSYPQGPWTSESQAGDEPAALVLSARRAIGDVRLAVRWEQNSTGPATTVRRAWLQTQLTAASRQDHAALRLVSNQSRLELVLPEGVDPRSLEVEVEGQRVVPESQREREVAISWDAGNGSEQLVELRYRFAARPAVGGLALEAPRVNNSHWIQQWYWQLCLPEHEHLLVAPDDYAQELVWVWSGWLWSREATLDTRQLATWAGCGDDESGDAVLAAAGGVGPSGNRYLFSTVGQVAPLRVYTLARSRLVLLASLPLLAIGLTMIYFPKARHPAVLLALALIVATASLAAPQAAMLLAQAALLGLALTVVAVLLAALLPRVAPAPPAAAPASSRAILERSVTELYQRGPAGSSPASTASDPLVSAPGEVPT